MEYLYGFGGVAAFVAVLVAFGFIAASLRKVVKPNEVHVVREGTKTIIFGGDDGKAGNSYYSWPAWIPFIGRQVSSLPLAVFKLPLDNYDAYDVGKVPFRVDVTAFFRLADPSVAAKRINSVEELKTQLRDVLEGAVRNILAQADIETIMADRRRFGEAFTQETADGLEAWGIINVKDIEFMDIRDGAESSVITNIMARKESLIDMQSREEVAENNKNAKVAEVAAQQDVLVREQQALEVVGQRTASKEQTVGIANEQAKQSIAAEAATTKEKEMAVVRVATVKQAEITKQAQVVSAEQDRDTKVIEAEGTAGETIKLAEGVLVQQLKDAEGIAAIGDANAGAAKALEMAAVEPQITLATEIGENQGYQTYLIAIKSQEVNEAVGIEQARALQAAGIKVIVNSGDPNSGLTSVGDIFSSKGGLAIGAAIEGLANTDGGQALLESFDVDVPAHGGNGAAA